MQRPLLKLRKSRIRIIIIKIKKKNLKLILFRLTSYTVLGSPRKFPTTCNLSTFASGIGHVDYVNGPVYVNVKVNARITCTR